MRAVGACSSWVVVGNGGAVRVSPARTVDGRPEDGSPGHPRRPVSAGRQSGGSATGNPTPATAGCPRRGSAHEGTAPEGSSRPAGAGSGRQGRLAHDASTGAVVGPPRRARRGRSRRGRPRRPRLRRRVTVSTTYRRGQRPRRLAPCTVPGRSARCRRGRRKPRGSRPDDAGAAPRVEDGPCGSCGVVLTRRSRRPGGGSRTRRRDRRVGGHVTRDVPGAEIAGWGVT